MATKAQGLRLNGGNTVEFQKKSTVNYHKHMVLPTMSNTEEAETRKVTGTEEFRGSVSQIGGER